MLLLCIINTEKKKWMASISNIHGQLWKISVSWSLCYCTYLVTHFRLNSWAVSIWWLRPLSEPYIQQKLRKQFSSTFHFYSWMCALLHKSVDSPHIERVSKVKHHEEWQSSTILWENHNSKRCMYPMFTETLWIIATTWKQPKHHVHQQMNGLKCYMYVYICIYCIYIYTYIYRCIHIHIQWNITHP